MNGLELLTASEMARADKCAVSHGSASLSLMEQAGRAVAEAAWRRVARGARVVVLCGPGNNGGDGYVAARLLAEHGCDVAVVALGGRAALKGDAEVMANLWGGSVLHPSDAWADGVSLVVDALFGAGLSRPLDGEAAALVATVNGLGMRGVPVIAVDVPSGLDGTTGLTAGAAVTATETVTFFRRKPGHLLLPGRALCGPTTVADIGIPDRVVDEVVPQQWANAPMLWLSQYPWARLDGHKYARGHAVVVSGAAETSGAARLGARAALRAGAGLVTLVGGAAATTVNATHANAVMVRRVEGARGLAEFLTDERRNAVLIGPGAGVGGGTAADVLAVLASKAAAVLDADALTSFETRAPSQGLGFLGTPTDAPAGATDLFAAIKERDGAVVLTPHDGEFKRLFGAIEGSKLDRARKAADLSGAVVILKGADTVIAAPGGRAAINENAPPWLATAGSGDVLGGFVTGLLAQGMPTFEAACAAVWLHGEVADAVGPGLIAEDLTERLPEILANLHHAAGAPGWVFRGPA
ncbi:MAG: NAD(P)H-hydrate dehydratase [Hyphomicrobiaceae bacterium]|nr:NAD(P)H-hydrate dehydratase [Hyphomicrobiaceae bacterium]